MKSYIYLIEPLGLIVLIRDAFYFEKDPRRVSTNIFYDQDNSIQAGYFLETENLFMFKRKINFKNFTYIGEY